MDSVTLAAPSTSLEPEVRHPPSKKGLPAFPNGWYAIGFSSELPPGAIVTRRFMGQEIVAFRTRSGVLSVIDAYCPHLGAHLGYGSTVDQETIRCPFHYFCFDTNGVCVSTGYGTRPPSKAVVRTWTARERNGIVLVWYHAGGSLPTWEIPELEVEDFTPLIWRQWSLISHPQETTENSVDIGHLSIVHGYDHVEMLSDLTTTGPYLTVRYAMHRRAGLVGGLIRGVRSEFDIHVHGLGYSFVDVNVVQYGINTQLFVLATPTDIDSITLRTAISVRKITQPKRVHPALAVLPGPLIVPIMNRLIPVTVLNSVAHDVQQDFEIWQHKVYFTPPILAEGDGPVGKYRQWVKQFYVEE
jgi:nitrite reductase/ring-hydroxylating ferredoxin subunit